MTSDKMPPLTLCCLLTPMGAERRGGAQGSLKQRTDPGVRGKLEGSFGTAQCHSVPRWLPGSFVGTWGTGKQRRLREGYSLLQSRPSPPHCGREACYFLLWLTSFLPKRGSFCDKRKNQ